MAVPTFELQRDTLEKEAHDFDANVVLPWYDDVVTLDAATVQARGSQIIDGWQKLLAANSRLGLAGLTRIAELSAHAQEPAPAASDATTSDGGDTARPDPAKAKHGDPSVSGVSKELSAAHDRIEASRKWIGRIVGLQDFNNHAVLRGYRVMETGRDPTVFVDAQVDNAVHAFSIILRVGQLCDHPMNQLSSEPSLTFAQEDKLVAIMQETRSEMEYKFVMAALRYLGYDAMVYSIGTYNKGRMVAHHDKLQELDAAQGGDEVTPELAIQMSDDVDRIAREVNDPLVALDSVIDGILDKYESPPSARKVFIRLLERRCLVDVMMSRGNKARVGRFVGRAYDANNDTDRSVGTAVVEIGTEAGRQAPGAVCQFMAGVYAGMGSLPMIGDTMKDASEAFKGLAKDLDEVTGAWKPGTETRDKIAWWTGFGLEKVGEIGVTRQMAGTAALNEVRNLKEAVDLGSVGYHYVAQARQLYDKGAKAWRFFFDSLPKMLEIARSGVLMCDTDSDEIFDAGLTLAGAGFKTCTSLLKKELEKTFTAEGRVEEAKEKREEATQDHVEDASGAGPVGGLPVGAPKDLRDGLNRLRRVQQKQLEARTDDQRSLCALEAHMAAQDIKDAAARLDAQARDTNTNLRYQQLDKDRQQEQAKQNAIARDLERRAQARGGTYEDEVIGDMFNHLLIEGGVGILEKVGDAVIAALKAARKKKANGERAGLDWDKLKRSAAKGAAGAVVEAMTTSLITPLKMMVKGWLLDKIAARIEKDYPGAGGAAQLLSAPIDQLVDYVTKSLPKEWLEDKIDDGVDSLFSDGADRDAAAAE
jgi:hypothetical protein